MKQKINVCFYSGSRSEYGILSSLISEFAKNKKINTHLVLSGTHFDSKFGSSYKEVKKENTSYEKIKLNLKSESFLTVTNSMGTLFKKISFYFAKKKIDYLFILGDRYDLIPVAYSALLKQISICHIHGGELTSGIIDDYVRHSVTKLSNFHFVSNLNYKKRIEQMGENPKHVFSVGSTSIDKIKNMTFHNKEFLEKKLRIKFKKNILLVTYQPLSLKIKQSKKEVTSLLDALKTFKNYTIIFTFPNFDIGSDFIINKINDVEKKYDNIFTYKSLGQKNYISLANICSAVIGNSSSGIIEIPYLGIPVVNIGERQNGRIKHPNIINCNANKKQIKISIQKAINNRIKIKIESKKNKIYGKGDSSKKIIKIFEEKIIKWKKNYNKQFFDWI